MVITVILGECASAQSCFTVFIQSNEELKHRRLFTPTAYLCMNFYPISRKL